MSSRQEQIEGRRREAKEKQFAARASTVTHSALGTLGEREHELRFCDGTFTITTFFYGDQDGAASSAEIKFNGRVVFQEGGGMITSYVPGELWEAYFDQLVQRAERSPQVAPPRRGSSGRYRRNR